MFHGTFIDFIDLPIELNFGRNFVLQYLKFSDYIVVSRKHDHMTQGSMLSDFTAS